MELGILQSEVCEVYQDSGVYVFAINMLQGPGVTNTWAQYYQITYPMLWDGYGYVMNSYEATQTIYRLPIIIDQDTIIQYREEGTFTLDSIIDMIEELLNTGVSENEVVTVPATIPYCLRENYPDPFKVKTTIQYVLPKVSKVELIVYDVFGQRVKTLLNQEQQAGYYTAFWDGEDEDCDKVPSGIYFCRIKIDGWTSTIKMLLLK